MFLNGCFSFASFGRVGNFCIDFAYETSIEWLSQKVLEHRLKVFYTGALSSALAVLAALVGRVACSFFYAIPAVLCLGLAAWAFQKREIQVSEELGAENEKLSLSLNDVKDQLEKEKEVKETLYEQNEMFVQLHEKQRLEIIQLQEDNEFLQETNDRYRRQNDEVQESLERYDGYLGRLSLLEKEITGHEEDSGLY